jgi:hypothetical protein
VSAKLYQVTVTQIYESGIKVRVSKYWIAATTPAQAKKRAYAQCYIEVPQSQVHLRSELYRGGHCRISFATLSATP